MRPLRIALVFALTLVCAAVADDLQLNYPYGASSITLTVNGCYRIRCEGGPHPLLVVQNSSYDRYLGATKFDDFKITYCNTEISDAEMKTIFESALDTVRHFRFDKPGLGVMDGSSVTLDIESINNIEVTIGPLANPEDASPGIARIMAIADAHTLKDWEWNKKLPPQLATDIMPRHRKPSELPAIFKGGTAPTVKLLLKALGRPDGFSKQFWQLKTKGTSYVGNIGGTLLFLLDDGTEVHVWTPDFKKVFFATHYRHKENEESPDDVLFTVPIPRN